MVDFELVRVEGVTPPGAPLTYAEWQELLDGVLL